MNALYLLLLSQTEAHALLLHMSFVVAHTTAQMVPKNLTEMEMA